MKCLVNAVALLLLAAGEVAGTIVQPPSEGGCSRGCICVKREEAVCNASHITEVPRDLPLTLRRLVINHSGLTAIYADTFARYSKLETLQLNYNDRLEKIGSSAFRGMAHLKTLAVQHNIKLTSLDSLSFAHVASAKTAESDQLSIFLRNNSIGAIRARTFFNNRGVRKLDLRENPIKTVEAWAFSGILKLDFLHLPEQIETIEAEAFRNLSRVYFLPLTKWNPSKFGGVAEHTFRGLRNVNVLQLKQCNLGKVHSRAFGGLQNAGIVKIEDSNISFLRRRAFSGWRNVGMLKLERNKIDRLGSAIFGHLNVEQELVFEDNHFNCSCGNMWLLDRNFNVSRRFLERNYCYAPKFFDQRPLNYVAPDYVSNCTATMGPLGYFDQQGNGAPIPVEVSRTLAIPTFICFAAYLFLRF